MSTYHTLQRLGFVLENGQSLAQLNAHTPFSQEPRARPYEAAGGGRRTYSWYAPSMGPNAALQGDLTKLRNRSRGALRNNPWLKQGLKRHISQQIGAHIRPLWKLDDEVIRGQLEDRWDNWVEHADADGIFTFYGLLGLSELTRRVAGECFIRIRPRRPTAGLAIPLQLQVLEPEYVPIDLNRRLRNGNIIVSGIEFNRRGQRVAYWMHPRHPEEAQRFGLGAAQPIRIPARFVIHNFQPSRPGQVRGEPDTAQSLVAAMDYHEYADAERVRKKTKASHTAVVERQLPPDLAQDANYDPLTGEALKPDVDDQEPFSEFAPGMINVMNYGESVKFPDGDATGQGYNDYQRWQLLGIAAGLCQPYQILSGDMSGINDRLWRAITNEYYRAIDIDRIQITQHQVCEPTLSWFVDLAWLAEAVTLPGFEDDADHYKAVEWQPHGRQYINRLQDVQADALDLKNGLASREGILARRGVRVEDVDRQNAEAKKREAALSLNYDTSGQDPPLTDAPDNDPRNTNNPA